MRFCWLVRDVLPVARRAYMASESTFDRLSKGKRKELSMFKKKQSSSGGGAPAAHQQRPPASPYLDARREWDERYGDALTRAKNWQRVAFLSLSIAAAAVLGVAYIGSQSKIQPFVIAVDDLGSPLAVAKPQALARASMMDERVIRSQVANFIFNARTVIKDFEAQKVLFDRVYSMLASDATPVLTEFLRDKRMPLQQRGAVVNVSIQSVIPAGKDTFQVDWIETILEPGSSGVREQWRALITIGVDEDLAQKQFYWNPFGVYVKQISWQKVSV